jgi:hypothetical protein
MQSRDLVLSHEDIARGFMLEGRRWPLWNPQRGIFKPREMPFLLSIRTVFPRKGGRVWYDDQRQVHQKIFAGEEEASPPCRIRLLMLSPQARQATKRRCI